MLFKAKRGRATKLNRCCHKKEKKIKQDSDTSRAGSMSGRRWGQIDRSRIQEGQAGGFIANEWGLPERGRGMDGQTDNMNGRSCRSSAQYQRLGGRWRGRKSSSKQHRQIRVSADTLRRTYTRVSVPLSSFSLGSLFPPGLDPDTRTRVHIRRTASPFELSPPGSGGEGGQSAIYALQFIFVLEAPRRLSSVLAWGNYTYTGAISPPVTAR